jgi:Uma2 family endonuclease
MQTLPRLDHWTRAEYERLAAMGALEGARVELIGGTIVAMAAKGPVHRVLVNRARRALERAFPSTAFVVWTEQPLALTDQDEPEPDVTVTAGRDEDYLTGHPTPRQTALVVEIAATTLTYDLGDKADLYAAAGIDDYWVVNLPAGVVVVLRVPEPNDASATGVRYAERREYRSGDQITPLAAGAVPVAVSDLLP